MSPKTRQKPTITVKEVPIFSRISGLELDSLRSPRRVFFTDTVKAIHIVGRRSKRGPFGKGPKSFSKWYFYRPFPTMCIPLKSVILDTSRAAF